MLKIIFDQVKALARSNPGTEQVQAIHQHQGSGLQPTGGGHDATDALKALIIVEDALVRDGDLWSIGEDVLELKGLAFWGPPRGGEGPRQSPGCLQPADAWR